ncbi:MAG: signal peptidase II [Chloroflexota bacterium]|nr:signal peptidase II [Chloroflexota bacterium]
MIVKRARIYDALALLTVIIVIVLDQWTKSLVVQYLSPPDSGRLVPLIGDYLTLNYTRNNGAAFSLFANNIFLAVFIAIAIGVIVYLYLRMLSSGPLAYKLIFGLIIGGALGNLIDRARHGGYVVDFLFFRIPQIGFRFAIFNLADASISIGVFLLFLFIIFGSLHRPGKDSSTENSDAQPSSSAVNKSGVLRSTEQDAHS